MIEKQLKPTLNNLVENIEPTLSSLDMENDQHDMDDFDKNEIRNQSTLSNDRFFVLSRY